MIRATLYTSIGAAALAVDFVTSPQKEINWLKKAERRGSRLAKTSQAQVRPVTKQVESAIEELRVTSLSALGLAERRAEKAEAQVKATVRRSTPKPRVSPPPPPTPPPKAPPTTLPLPPPPPH